MEQVPEIMEKITFDTTFAVFDLLAVFMFASSGALARLQSGSGLGVFMR